jgi:hypothetical protein
MRQQEGTLVTGGSLRVNFLEKVADFRGLHWNEF